MSSFEFKGKRFSIKFTNHGKILSTITSKKRTRSHYTWCDGTVLSVIDQSIDTVTISMKKVI